MGTPTPGDMEPMSFQNSSIPEAPHPLGSIGIVSLHLELVG